MGKLAAIALLLVPAAAYAQPRPRNEPDRAATYAIPVDGYPSDGPADAKVTLVIAHDYADPYSERNRATLDELRKKYDKDLRIVFRNMIVHPRNAMAAALASCAAHKQNKFDLLEDKLWEAFRQRQFDMTEVDQGNGPQKCWDTVEGCQIVVGLAKDVGLKVDRFKADMKACVQIVDDDRDELQNRFAIRATPSFFINGRFVAGAMPTEQFVQIVDEELAKANDRIKKGTPKARYYKSWIVDKGEKKVDVTAAPVGGPPTPSYTRYEPDRAKSYAIPVDGYPSHGPVDAAVTMVIAHDYADPYSHRNRDTLTALRGKYGKDLRIVYRNMVVHPTVAMAGALASCAAFKQKKFDAMEDKLWEAYAQRQLDASDVNGVGSGKCWETANGCQHVTRMARDIGLDMNRFNADMQACTQIVQADMRELQGFAIAATPSFFINGRYLSGAMPTENYEKIIDEELAKANDRIKKGTPRARYYKSWIVDKGEKKVEQPAVPVGGTQPTNPVGMGGPRRPEPDKSKNYAIRVDGFPSKGPADAKVTVVMFFDYASPYAERARTTLDDLMQRYGKDLRIVYRTRLVHPRNASAAALAMCAADKQKKFAAMDAAIWDKGFKARQLDDTEVDLGNGPQKCWDTPDSCKIAVSHAQDIGLDLSRFKRDLKACEKQLTDDDTDAASFQVNATPTFFINGRVLQGALPVENFAVIVDDELAKANERIKKGTPKARYYKSWILDKGEKQVSP